MAISRSDAATIRMGFMAIVSFAIAGAWPGFTEGGPGLSAVPVRSDITAECASRPRSARHRNQ
jgi:hypothetical protein